MGLRLSISEAQQKKLISESQAQEMRRQQSAKRSGGSRPEKLPSSHKTSSPQQLFCSIEGNTPQEKLWRALVRRYPELVQTGDLCWELGGVVPGRKFSLDIAMKDIKLGCEILLTPPDILMQTQQFISASMHTGMYLVAREL